MSTALRFHRSPAQSRRWAGSFWALPLTLLMLLVGLWACAPEPGPGEAGNGPGDLPDGAWAYGEATALRPLLEALTRFEGSPAAKHSTRALSALAECDHFAAYIPGSSTGPGSGPGPDEWISTLGCADDSASPRGSEPKAVAELRTGADGRADWILSALLPRSDSRFVLKGAGNRLTLELPANLPSGPLDLLLPAPRAGAREPLLDLDLLDRAGALLHLGIRTDRGLDPAAWVAQGGSADRLFGLRGRLFSRAVLGDSWEVAVLPPEIASPGDRSGRAHLSPVAAIGIRSRAATAAAISSFEAEIGRVWGLLGRPTELTGGQEATCFDQMRVLPGLHPCWHLGDTALLVGWSPRALERLLPGAAPKDRTSEGPREPMDVEDRGGMSFVSHFDRFRAAELDLAHDPETEPEASPGAESEALLDYPWSRVEIGGGRDGEVYRFEIFLTPKTPAPSAPGSDSLP